MDFVFFILKSKNHQQKLDEHQNVNPDPDLKQIPSGKLTWLTEKWTWIEDVFPIENGDFPAIAGWWFQTFLCSPQTLGK